jgi:hypothetical protein
MTDYRAYSSASPPTAATADDVPYTLGLEFYVVSQAWFKFAHFFQPSTNSPSSAVRKYALFKVTGQELIIPFTDFSATVEGWNTKGPAVPLALEVNTRYKLGIYHPAGRYSSTGGYYSTGDGTPTKAFGPLRIPDAGNALGGGQNTFIQNATPGYPTTDVSSANYWGDVTVTDVAPVTNKSLADEARENMLTALSYTVDQAKLKSNVDLMREVVVAGGLGLITVGNDTYGNHYERYLKTVRDS